MKQHSDLTIIYCCRSTPQQQNIDEYQKACGQLILVYSTKIEFQPNGEFTTVPWAPEKGKAAALNKAVQKASGTHILLLEENETLPEVLNLDRKTFYPARITNLAADTPIINWQIRLFPAPKSEAPFFRGFEIPDPRHSLYNSDIQPSDHPLTIHKKGALFPAEDIRRETSSDNMSPMHEFWKGILASEKEDFLTAAQCFKNVLKEQDLKLTPWNKLAALNNLANALMENYEFLKARQTAEQSLALTPHQWAPHLTIYQYHNLKGEDEKAYQQLVDYQRVTENDTEANWDIFMPKAHVAFLTAQVSYHQGWHEKAYYHYNQFFNYNNGQVGRPILEKLFLYAVKLDKQKKAISYFKALFKNYLTNPAAAGDQVQDVKQALSLITDKGWYDSASDIYRQLVSRQPHDESLRHGLIRTLVKNEQVEKAQALLSSAI